LEAVRGLYRVDNLDQFGPIVLESLESLIPCDTSSYNEVDPVAGRAVVLSRPDPITDEELAIWQKWAHQNPALMHMLRTGDGSARRISDFLDQDELHGLELYRYGYARIGVEYQLSVGLPAPSPIVLGVALNRGSEDFTDAEVGVLEVLRPHVAQAYRNAQLITEHRRALDRIAGALEDDGRAFHVLGEPLVDSVRALLGRHFRAVSSRLPDEVRVWADEELSGLQSGGPERLRQSFVSIREGRRLTIRFVPGGSGPPLLWLVERPTESDSTPLQRLGLSPREAQVLWALTKGGSTTAISRQLSISIGTTKKHLEHVYRKLGVSTATAAAAVAFDVLSD
jgi:DNA-binding CsgD family transcriptional regulator